MVADEGAPGLGWWTGLLDHVLSDGAFGQLVAELEQFAVDARRAPERVLSRQLANQSPHLSFHEPSPPASRPTPAPPVQPPAQAVPADDCVRLDDKQMATPLVADPAEQDPERAIGGSEARSTGRTLQDRDLVPQGEVLEGQLLSGAQARDAGAQE